MVKNNLHIYSIPQEVVVAIADRFVDLCKDTLGKKASCNVVLSGGNSPKALYQLLASAGYRNKIEWKKLYFFFGDERFVPFDHADSNGRMAKEILFDPLQIETSHIFYINTALAPPLSATEYENNIGVYFDKDPVAFDIILLGLGDNAHTASLFPGTAVLEEKTAGIKEVFIPSLNAFRITMTAPLINRSQHILFLVYGSSKATAVAQIIQHDKNFAAYPAQLIHPDHGETEWFLDRAAAALLRK